MEEVLYASNILGNRSNLTIEETNDYYGGFILYNIIRSYKPHRKHQENIEQIDCLSRFYEKMLIKTEDQEFFFQIRRGVELITIGGDDYECLIPTDPLFGRIFPNMFDITTGEIEKSNEPFSVEIDTPSSLYLYRLLENKEKGFRWIVKKGKYGYGIPTLLLTKTND